MINKDNILPALTNATTVMHDHNTINYHSGFLFRNVECLQHLERDLQKISDISHHSWAIELKELIKCKIHERKELISNEVLEFSAMEITAILKDVDSLLTKGNLECSSDSNHYFTKDKVSGQFQSIEYASYFADIRTYLETCSRNGINEFSALLRLTNGTPYSLNELLGGA